MNQSSSRNTRLFFTLIQRIRDETHRFAVTFHRQRRGKRTLTSELFAIPGISEKTSKLLLRKFGSAKDLQRTSLEDLSKEVAPRLAKTGLPPFPSELITVCDDLTDMVVFLLRYCIS